MELTRISGILLALFGILITCVAALGQEFDGNLLGSGITSILVGTGLFFFTKGS